MSSGLFTRIVLSGGEFKGFMYVGVFQYIEECWNEMFVQDTKVELVGVSSGAMMASFLALGMPANKIKEVCLSFSILDCCDVNFKSLMSIFSTFGIDSGQKYAEQLKFLITLALGPGKENITLKEVDELQDQRYKLVLVSANLTQSIAEYLSCDTHPNLPLWKAIMMSSAYPFYFPCIRHNDNLYIDGAVLDNYPLIGHDMSTLGFLLDKEKVPTSGSTVEAGGQQARITTLASYILRITLCLLSSLQYMTGRVGVPGVTSVRLQARYDVGDLMGNRQKEKEMKLKLIEDGYAQVSTWHNSRRKNPFLHSNEIP
jgi:predicted acylesterase/phospholipase RssA